MSPSISWEKDWDFLDEKDDEDSSHSSEDVLTKATKIIVQVSEGGLLENLDDDPQAKNKLSNSPAQSVNHSFCSGKKIACVFAVTALTLAAYGAAKTMMTPGC